jgi:hypothetical protein
MHQDRQSHAPFLLPHFFTFLSALELRHLLLPVLHLPHPVFLCILQHAFHPVQLPLRVFLGGAHVMHVLCQCRMILDSIGFHFTC